MLEIMHLSLILVLLILSIGMILKLKGHKCPKKIKIFFRISLFLVITRYTTLLLCVLLEKQNILYYIKIFSLINYIYIPSFIVSCLYIFLRDNKRKFNYNFLCMILFIIISLIIYKFFKLEINVDNKFGFVIEFRDILIPKLIYLIILSTLSIISILYIDKNYSNKSGMKLLILSVLLLIFENIIQLSNFKIFPYEILGEMLILITTCKSINTFKIKR